MFSKKSIQTNFIIKLFLASTSLIFIFSSILYFYIENSIYDEKREELLQYAKNIANNRAIINNITESETFPGLNIEVIYLKKYQGKINFYINTLENKKIITLIYPYNINNLSYLKISKNITNTTILLDKILHYIFIINIAGVILIIFYAIGLSKMLIKPVETLSAKLSNMNEHLIKPIKVKELPEEFEPLGITINHLITRIQNFVKYQKELFIGTAHELKTPLAVIKLKNQVTLIKKRDSQEYIDALKTTNKTIDEMNIVVSNILNIGRQEGAQLDKPVTIDIISFLKEKANNFKLLAESEDKILDMSFEPNGFMATLQLSLLNQVLQNFLQNALKFTPKNKKVIIKSSQDDVGLLIEIIDEGCGIDENIDLFAPFKRQGNKSGVGLGLFLAQSAAGENPVLAVKTMVQTIQGAEKIYPFNKFSEFKIADATDSINSSAVRLCEEIDAWGLICLTASGSSARKLSRYRPRRDIYAVVQDEKIARFLTICWGVVPAFLVKKGSLGQTMSQVMNQGLDRKVLKLDKCYILTAGDPVGVVGSTNMIRILREYEMMFFKELK